jgi:hypothetical protein
MKKFFLVIFFFPILKSAFCQDEGEATKIVTSRTLQSSNGSGFFSYNNFTKLNATNDGTAAEANIDYSINSFNLNLSASTPVSSKSQRVKPLTIAGLTNNSTLTAGIQKIFWGNGFKWNPKSFAAARKAIRKDTGDFKTKDLTDLQKAKFYEIADIDWGTDIFIGLKGGLEQQEFKYISNQTTFADAEDSKTALNISASFGIMAHWGIIALSFTHQNGYHAGDPVKYFIPIDSSGVQIEKELSPGAPQHQNSEKLRFEFLSIGRPKIKGDEVKSSPFRINPNINLEFNQQLVSFEFPVYFFTSDKERTNFNGGIYAGYVSDKDFKFNTNKKNFGFGVFIGANFTRLFQ